MSICVFIAPSSVWHPSNVVLAKPQKAHAAPRQPSWEEHAFAQNWSGALLGYLQQHWRGSTKMWSLINAVVSESCPEERWEVRESTKEALRVLMGLVRERRVIRYRKKWIAALDLAQQIVPLEQIPPHSLRRI